MQVTEKNRLPQQLRQIFQQTHKFGSLNSKLCKFIKLQPFSINFVVGILGTAVATFRNDRIENKLS